MKRNVELGALNGGAEMLKRWQDANATCKNQSWTDGNAKWGQGVRKAVIVLLIFFVAVVHAQRPVVAGYVFARGQALKPGSVNALSMTRVNYAFANIRHGEMVEGSIYDAANLAYLTGLRKENPSLTVLVSVGGWLGSGEFSDVALTADSRGRFIASVVDFLRRYDLDGLDIDWEYPGIAGAGHRFRAEDKQDFTALLVGLRARFDGEEKKLHRHWALTIAAGANEEFLEHTEMGKVAVALNAVNLMAYDYYEPGDSATTGHHSPLYMNPADPKKVSAAQSVEAFLRAGVPAEKIVLGVPFYGHAWANVPAAGHGLYQPGTKSEHISISYPAIRADGLDGGFTRYWDDVAKAPWLYNAEKKLFVSYEDPESLKIKCRYVLEHHLGGVMFWSYENDDSGELLRTINSVLRPGVVAPEMMR